MKKEPLIIFPYNGNGIEALDCLEGNNYDLIGFIDDTKEKLGKKDTGVEVFSRDLLNRYPESKVLAVPGSPTSYLKRKEIIDGLKIEPNRFTTLIHPKAIISKNAKIGFNVLIMGGAVITSNAIIGNHVIILPNSVIHHDDTIGDYTLIGSNVTIAGYVQAGRTCYIGSASSIINNIEIGDNSLIGIGSNVIKSVPPNSKIVGNPGRIL